LRWIQGWEQRTRTGLALDLVIDVDGFVAGEVGLASFDATRRAAMMGYWLAPAERGAGLAGHAAAAVTEWFLSPDGCAGNALVAICHVDNQSAHRVAERAGLSLLGPDPQSRHAIVFARQTKKRRK